MNANGIFIIEIPSIIGTNNPANNIVEKPTIGANLNTQDVVSEYTVSFFNNLKTS